MATPQAGGATPARRIDRDSVACLAVAALKSPVIAAYIGHRAPPGYADWA